MITAKLRKPFSQLNVYMLIFFCTKETHFKAKWKVKCHVLIIDPINELNPIQLCFIFIFTSADVLGLQEELKSHSHPPTQNVHGPCSVPHWSQAISSILCPFSHQCWRQSGVWTKDRNWTHACRNTSYLGSLKMLLPGIAGWRSSGMDSRSPGLWWPVLLLTRSPPAEGWTCSTWRHGKPSHTTLPHIMTMALPWWLADHTFSCHDSEAPTPLLARCHKSSNWAMLYSSSTGRIYIPSRYLVTETSARLVLIGEHFIECCFLKTLSVSLWHTKAPPLSLESDLGQMKQEVFWFDEKSLTSLPLANILIRKDATFPPSTRQLCVCTSSCLVH